MNPRDATTFTADALAALRSRLRGVVLLPDDACYDEARMLWNAMMDRHPAIVVRPRGAADVMTAVRFGREHGLKIALKGGGHNVAGHAACDGGLMIDFSNMTSVRVDPGRCTASVEPGALLSDLDREAQAHGLATPVGFISSTGVAGLTLGGGFGYLSRKHGLTVDNLRGVDLVTAKGSFTKADPGENSDLFWALRGGGGNFGAVTSFDFDLHPLGPEVLAGPVVHALEDAPAAMRGVATAMGEAPEEVSCLAVLRHAPPAPFLPEEVHGKLIVLFALIHAGDAADGEAALAPLRAVGRPIADAVGLKPYAAFQAMFDKTASAGARNYWKSHYLPELSGSAIDLMCERAARMTSKETSIGMLSLGGAIARHEPGATSYPHRDASWVLNIQSRWRDAVDDGEHIGWARDTFDALTPMATGGAYVNFISGDEGLERVRAAYDEATYARLAKIKASWDPENLFHLNQNILPSAAA